MPAINANPFFLAIFLPPLFLVLMPLEQFFSSVSNLTIRYSSPPFYTLYCPSLFYFHRNWRDIFLPVHPPSDMKAAFSSLPMNNHCGVFMIIACPLSGCCSMLLWVYTSIIPNWVNASGRPYQNSTGKTDQAHQDCQKEGEGIRGCHVKDGPGSGSCHSRGNGLKRKYNAQNL